jgi:hypothetical protein
MRRNRRGGSASLEFGGSGEDSFVAVVVTKLTGALLFILLLAMTIMALLPKAVDVGQTGATTAEPTSAANPAPLQIRTPSPLPEAIAGRPYSIALAATGGLGTYRWSLDGPLPAGLELDPETGIIQGTPAQGTPQSTELRLQASDGRTSAVRKVHLLVYQPDAPLSTPSWWKPGIPPISWRAYLDLGFGYLLLWLVHLVGMGTLTTLERSARENPSQPATADRDSGVPLRRFTAYRWILRTATLLTLLVLTAWISRPV